LKQALLKFEMCIIHWFIGPALQNLRISQIRLSGERRKVSAANLGQALCQDGLVRVSAQLSV
jgi:hypothetical protein